MPALPGQRRTPHPLILALLSVVSAASAAAPAAPAAPPLPFTRPLAMGDTGHDVLIAQAFLIRAVAHSNATIRAEDGHYADATARAAQFFRDTVDLPPGDDLDAPALAALLRVGGPDGYADDGQPASARGKLYKVHVKVHANRSIEDHTATLSDAHG